MGRGLKKIFFDFTSWYLFEERLNQSLKTDQMINNL